MNEESLTPSEASIKEITDLETGDHLCCIYENDEEHREVLTPFIKQGLEANQKVIYIVDANTADVILDYLRGYRLWVARYRDGEKVEEEQRKVPKVLRENG